MKKSLRQNLLMPLSLMAFLFGYTSQANSFAPSREYYELRIYQLKNADQEKRMDVYLKEALLPGLHRAGIRYVGVFKNRGIDTSSSPRIYVLIPYASLKDVGKTTSALEKDQSYLAAGKDYLEAVYDNPPYQRIEKILLHAFVNAPQMNLSSLSNPKMQRVYELRSYESSTEKIYRNKVKMFNDGDEIGLFKRLGFNAIFYGEVLAGGSMPNLMYMTSFEDMASRDKHWQLFRDDSQWKTLSAMQEYSHNVSASVIYFLFPTEYSDI